MTSIIIYSYFETDVAIYNLSFFIKSEVKIRDNIDYIFVINGNNCSVNIPSLPNVSIIHRENSGFDFGAHAEALQFLGEKKYDYYFFMNSGVFGPILPHYVNTHWSIFFIHKITPLIKLVGTTIVCLPSTDAGGYGPRVEGFFFMTDAIGLECLKNKLTIFYNHPTKYSAIVNGEYGVSNCILDNGYSMDCMIRKYQGINWRDPLNWNLNSNIHPTRKNSFYNNSLIPYELIFHKWNWANMDRVQFDIIQQYVYVNT